MELRHVRHFVAVADSGSLGRAADAIGVSQPALSKSVRQLEGELGVRLLERGPRGSVLSRYGEAFLEHARAMIVEAQNAALAVESLRKGKTGSLSVGISPSLARHVMPIATARVLGRHPAARLHVRTGMVDDLLALVRKGELDLAITAMADGFADPELAQEFIARDSLDIVARIGHPLRERPAVTLADLARQSWVVPSGAASGRTGLERAFLAARLPVPTPVVVSDSIAYIRALLPHTDHVSMLPLGILDAGQGPREIAPLVVPGHTLQRSIAATWRKRMTPSPLARQLVADVRATLRGLSLAK